MFFTLYYMYATFLQWWRLGALKNKLSGTLNSNNALLVCDESIIFDTRRTRSIENLLFRREKRIGVTVVPKQRINLCSQWLYFPRDSRYFPIFFKHSKLTMSSPNIYILIEAVLESYKRHQAEVLSIENFGELIAWRITDHFEAILRTDMDKLATLVNCFSHTDCDMNHELQILKIETIDVDGIAKRILYDRQYSTETVQKYSLAPVHWQKFVADLKDLYSKIRDATNPKITIDNGTPKPEDVKIVPVSEVKPIKKDKRAAEEKNTLEVNCSNYRRHRSAEHSREHKTRDHRRHRSKDETDSAKCHKTDKAEINELAEQEGAEKEEKYLQSEPSTSKQNVEVPEVRADAVSKEKKPVHKHREKHKHKRSEEGEKLVNNESQPGATSSSQKSSDKLKKGDRTSSKEKKLVRAAATCDEPTENEGEQDDKNRSENNYDVAEAADQNGPSLDGDEAPVSPDGCISDRKLLMKMKPPNILVYADSAVARQNVKEVLSQILNKDKYIIYDLPTTGPLTWQDSTALVVVCGSVEEKPAFNLMKFLLNGGQLLCLCSDLLYSVLHTFTTAEVREHELVRFTYGKWKNVKMMHHIFCYQASPAKKQFSKDSDASNHSSGNGSSPIAPRTPSMVDIQHGGKDYTIQVQVLGAEETWQTPSLLLASVKGSEGRAVFSQVHLEIDPGEYVDDESKFEALKDSNQARLDILKDILSNHLELDCDNSNETPAFTPAYFLGRYDLKLEMLNDSPYVMDNKIKTGDMHVVFCGKHDKYDEPTSTFLPILIHACPQHFNTVNYFETLATKEIGRLVIYSDVLTSSQALLQNKILAHGLAVICRQQVGGVGRSHNRWLSPNGSALFSLQLHLAHYTNLGRAQCLLQHLIMMAVIKAVKRLTGNDKNIKLGIKWPNDLYYNGCIKVGGAVVSSKVCGELSYVTIGCGINLSNSVPTTCINDIIRDVNERTGSKIPEIPLEKFVAQIFNETEKLFNLYQSGNGDDFFNCYYEYWLHNDANVTITSKDGKSHRATITGIDHHGFLTVRTAGGTIESVQPDGNSFDMLKGLIYPKIL